METRTPDERDFAALRAENARLHNCINELKEEVVQLTTQRNRVQAEREQYRMTNCHLRAELRRARAGLEAKA